MDAAGVRMFIVGAEDLDGHRQVEAPLVTTLGIVSGEVLTYLEGQGATALRRLVRELSWSSTIVVMAVGALIREGLIKATQHDLEVIVEPRREWTIPTPAVAEPAPEIWGG